MQALKSLDVKGRAILGACALGFLVAAVLIIRMAGSPDTTQVAAGIDPAEAAKVTAALDEQGIAYELGNGGTQVSVGSADLSRARVAMATAGVGAGAKQPGMELLDQQKLGTSNLQQQVAYQRALEGQIANTIGEIDGVTDAQVSLTLPKQDLFTEESDPATAAVLLKSTAGLDPASVKGIASLVSNSVQGLKPERVTITDGAGSVLWPQGDGGATAGATSKISAQQRYDQQMEAQLNGMLAATLGANKASAQVTSDLDVDDTTKESLTYGRRGTPTKVTTETERLRGTGGGAAGGTTGAAANLPAYAQATAGAGGGNSNYQRTNTSRDVAVDKTVTRTRVAPGAVRSLSVGLVVDSKLPPAVAQQAQAAVAGAAGVPMRSVTLARMPFQAATPPAASGGPIPSGILDELKTGGIVAAVLAFAALMARALRRRERSAFGEEPEWLRELAAPTPPALGPAEEPTVVRERPAPERSPNVATAEELADRDPQAVALQLRGWMAEDRA